MQYPAPYVLELEPTLVPKVWGGYSLPNMLRQHAVGPVGELWSLSAHPVRPTRIVNGPLAGRDLYEIRSVLGIWGMTDPFPVLIKFLETKAPLSLQVHPNDEQANDLESYELGKNEAWYILRADSTARVWLGLKSGITVPQFMNQPSTSLMREYQPTAGTMIPVPAGTPHATEGGLFFAEVQQNCDITYRIDDFGRNRELHLDKAAQVLSTYFESPDQGHYRVEDRDYSPAISRKLWSCFQFSMYELEVIKRTGTHVVQSGFEALTVLEGGVEISVPGDVMLLLQGRSVLIPKGLAVSLRSVGESARLLRVR